MDSTRHISLLLLTALLPACAGGNERVTELPDFEQRAAYAIGQDVGNSLAEAGVELDFDALVQGLRDAMDDEDSLLEPQEIMEVVQEFQMRAQEAMAAREEAAVEDNRAEGEAFRREHAERDGVVTTDSGLQYRFVTEGDGPIPGPADRVRVHYRGTFIDGEVFDSSYERDEPAVFQVQQVIPGWSEALQLTPVGSTVELVIPPNLGYGMSAPASIGPERTLLFEVEVLGIEDDD